LPAFLFYAKGEKRKAKKRETPFWKGFSPLHPRDLFEKKVDQKLLMSSKQHKA